MRFFRRRPPPHLLPSETDKDREKEIRSKIEKKNFEKALKMAEEYIEGCRGRDAYAEANYNYLAFYVLATQHGRKGHKFPLSEYKCSRNHLLRAVELYESIENGISRLFERGERKRIRCLRANRLQQIAILASLAGVPNDGLQECRTALNLFLECGYSPGVKSATKTWYLLRVGKMHEDIMELFTWPSGSRSTLGARAKKLLEENEKLREELR